MSARVAIATQTTFPLGRVRASCERLRMSAWAPAFLVLWIYAIWLIPQLPGSQGARMFVDPGNRFLLSSHASPIISAIQGIDKSPYSIGYDGQFVFYIALDPARAHWSIDSPSYRYTRIFYPILARVLSLGNPTTLPYVLLLINWLGLAAGTLLLVHALLFTIFLNASAYQWYADTRRIITGVVLAMLLCLPGRVQVYNGFRLIFLGAVDLLLWAAPAWLLLPVLNTIVTILPPGSSL